MNTTQTSIEIFLDDTVKENPFFQGITSIDINKTELFKYAIMMWEVPPKIVESDFDYLQSKVPALESLLSDFIEFSAESIYNLSNDDRVKKTVSEAVGVGLGLKYSMTLLKTNPNKFKKIGVPESGKYLDYSTISDLKEYEIETKGTVSNYYNSMKKDIIEKKANTTLKTVHLRYGTITLIKNKADLAKSKCVIVDDPPEPLNIEDDDTFITQLWNYAIFLSYIIDSKYYNRYVKPLRQSKLNGVKINDKKFFGKYSFEGKMFYGECFDYRLMRDLFKEFLNDKKGISELFKLITQKVGKTKFFIGLEESVINAINNRDQVFMKEYELEPVFIDEQNTLKFLDKDGILIVKSKDSSDGQLEKLFLEEEVEKRLGLYNNYIYGKAHQCKAPCRSREIKGKPCEKMTFREHCFFHR
ncbi:MAG TPA: hypothetical protein PK110_16090 [Niabella sp.]|nr:hypothetical protein [Niabella sp.]HRP33131.1 hypothetical protein [Agriterribacter sp.]